MASEVIPEEVRAKAHEAVFKALTRYDRTSFRRVLADLVGAAPTPEQLKEFAAKSPDKWAQALAILGGLAGFERGVVLSVNHYNVGEMSDAALLARARELEAALREAGPAIIDAEIVPEPAAEGVPAQTDAGSPADAALPPVPVFRRPDVAPEGGVEILRQRSAPASGGGQ